MAQTILVTGVSGLIGRRLVPRLLGKGAVVRTASRANADVRFDWNEPGTYEAALAGIDAVYLVPPAMVEDASRAVVSFLEHVKAAGVRRVVAVSSLGISFPTEPPASGRRRFEAAVMESGLAWTLLRPSGFMQNFSEGFLLPAIRHAGAIASAAGHGAVPFVDADDIAEVAVESLLGDGHAGNTYAITGPKAITFAEAAAVIAKAAQRKIDYHPVEESVMAGMMRDAGIPDDYAAMLLRDQHAIREGAAVDVADTLERICGRPPRPFAEFVRQAKQVWFAT